MTIDLINHNCKNAECKLKSQQTVFSVYGKAKGKNKPNYKLKNQSKQMISQLVVDDCLLLGETGSKCDYLFVTHDNNNQAKDGYFVEMKGKDIDKACEQILKSIELLKHYLTGNQYGRIVTTGTYPNFRQTPNYKKLSNTLKNNFKTNTLLIEDTI